MRGALVCYLGNGAQKPGCRQTFLELDTARKHFQLSKSICILHQKLKTLHVQHPARKGSSALSQSTVQSAEEFLLLLMHRSFECPGKHIHISPGKIFLVPSSINLLCLA